MHSDNFARHLQEGDEPQRHYRSNTFVHALHFRSCGLVSFINKLT